MPRSPSPNMSRNAENAGGEKLWQPSAERARNVQRFLPRSLHSSVERSRDRTHRGLRKVENSGAVFAESFAVRCSRASKAEPVGQRRQRLACGERFEGLARSYFGRGWAER